MNFEKQIAWMIYWPTLGSNLMKAPEPVEDITVTKLLGNQKTYATRYFCSEHHLDVAPPEKSTHAVFRFQDRMGYHVQKLEELRFPDSIDNYLQKSQALAESRICE